MAESPTSAAPDQVTGETFLIDDPVTLRAIAHPVRQEILEQLAMREHGRAADLAAALEQPANAISFHLRTLARAGLIIEAPEHARDRRDRVWKPAAESYQIDRKLPGATSVVESMIEWLGDALRAPADDETARHRLSRTPALFTEEEARSLMTELMEVIGRHQDRAIKAAGSPEDDRIGYQVLVAIGPRHTPAHPTVPADGEPAEN